MQNVELVNQIGVLILVVLFLVITIQVIYESFNNKR